MRIALLYPPPWKIPAAGEPPPGVDGPPDQYRDGDLDADFFQIPYGLLSLAAQALRAGHAVKVANLSSWSWRDVEPLLARLDADLYGLSCFTANRRGVALTARELRRHHPAAHIVVGGPHASALPLELLDHYPAIDTVVIGEGEQTVLELCERLATQPPVTGLAGTAYRQQGRPRLGPARARIDDLDALASPHDYFATHLVLTARGCPGRCTFCAKGVTWGQRYRTLSIERVVELVETALARLPVRMLLFKDDTFTAKRARGLALCRAIRQEGLSFLWSCDTRADALDEELLREMRLAGCQRLSLGVESGSPAILRNIQKGTTPAVVLAATRAAKRVGLEVRHYLMLGNRGETAATFRESLQFVAEAEPHHALFACLSVYPGTQDYRDLRAAGALAPEEYFTGSFQELKTPYDASAEDTALMAAWFERHAGLQPIYQSSVDEQRAILARLGDHHAAHLDLAAAHFRADELVLAERHARRALELGFPAPGLAHNLLACIAARREDWRGLEGELANAARDPQHVVVARNTRAVRRWRADGGPATRPLPELDARHDFQLLERTEQPVLPGPLPPDFARWP